MADIKETVTTKPKPKVRRAPINGIRNVLSIDPKFRKPGKILRLVNDDPGRVRMMESLGYEVVKDPDIKIGDERVGVPTPEGSPVKVHVGGGKYAYLMEQDEEYYKQDQDSKEARIREFEEAMGKHSELDHPKGELDITRGRR